MPRDPQVLRELLAAWYDQAIHEWWRTERQPNYRGVAFWRAATYFALLESLSE